MLWDCSGIALGLLLASLKGASRHEAIRTERLSSLVHNVFRLLPIQKSGFVFVHSNLYRGHTHLPSFVVTPLRGIIHWKSFLIFIDLCFYQIPSPSEPLLPLIRTQHFLKWSLQRFIDNLPSRKS
jgi:hypothetical protein